MSTDKPQIRKIYTVIEETHSDGSIQLDKPTRKAAAAAVFNNPYAAKYEEDLSLLYEWSEQLGEMLTQKAVAALGIAPDQVHSYGKGAIVGGSGELEPTGGLCRVRRQRPRAAGGGGRRAPTCGAHGRGGRPGECGGRR
mgnify:CR=1 FL=1